MRRARITARLEAFALTVWCLAVLTILSSPSAQAKSTPKKQAAQPKTQSHKEERKPAAQPKAQGHKEEKKPAAQPRAQSYKEERKPAAQPTTPIRVVSHNVEKDVAKDVPIHRAVSAAEAMGADIIALQEVCPDQYERLQKAHRNWTIGYVDQATPARRGCVIPGGYAIPRVVIAWLGGTDGVITHFTNLSGILGARGNGMVCVKFTRSAVPVHACSVHLASTQWTSPENVIYPSSELRLRAITGIKRIASDWLSKGHFVVIAGDFNANPHREEMDKMYDPRIPGGKDFKGDFTEYNRPPHSRDGEFTADPPLQPLDPNDPNDPDDDLKNPPPKKIDYIFFSTNRAPLNGGGFTRHEKTGSDHRMISSTAQMSLKLKYSEGHVTPGASSGSR